MSSTERMEDVKIRNSSFWHQSKNIREIVEAFGTCGRPDVLEGENEAESGPFFTGLDVVLAVPQFSIRLCSPTSTSKHIEVSLNFSTKHGIIMQLNNPAEDQRSAMVAFFDVSWIGRYPDEDERLFVGMIHTTKFYTFLSK